MAQCYADEEEAWKCPKHPSRRRRPITGVCHLCLRERLSALCPNCAKLLPCPCCPNTTSSSSSSSSSATSSSISALIASEPSFRRSKSVAVPFLRSHRPPMPGKSPSPSLWSMFRKSTKKKGDGEDSPAPAMMRSRSVAVVSSANATSSPGKGGKGWYFPSPMKAFRQSSTKSSKVVQERSPLHRG